MAENREGEGGQAGPGQTNAPGAGMRNICIQQKGYGHWRGKKVGIKGLEECWSWVSEAPDTCTKGHQSCSQHYSSSGEGRLVTLIVVNELRSDKTIIIQYWCFHNRLCWNWGGPDNHTFFNAKSFPIEYFFLSSFRWSKRRKWKMPAVTFQLIT